jgi:hypothetical protein
MNCKMMFKPNAIDLKLGNVTIAVKPITETKIDRFTTGSFGVTLTNLRT